MATETQFTILLWEIGIAVLVQVGVLIGILLAVQKSSARLNSIADDIHKRTVPILESTNALLANTKPQIETIVENLTVTSENLKTQVDDIIDRARLQVVRADQLVTSTMDKVEEVQQTVISPVRQLAGVLQGLSMGFNVLFGRRGHNGHSQRGGNGAGVPRDEMFI